MDRISDSPGFRVAPRLREFLLFVTDRALSDRADEISEQRIGHEVFHRSENYDTANDNIVRVSARQLRVKLKEFTDGEGRDEPWVLEVPKGAYVPVFIRRTPQASDALRDPVCQDEPHPARLWKIAAFGCALIALALAVALLRSATTLVGAQRAAVPLTDLVIRPNQRTLIVLADSSLVLLHELTGEMVNVDDYAAQRYPSEQAAGKFARSLAAQQLTSVADVGFAIRLLRARPDAADRLVVVHARDVGPRNLKSDNLILIGGPRSNPWIGLFDDRLNFRFEFRADQAWARIVNLKPKAGEPEVYETAAGKAFARIASVPNLNNAGRVLLVSGTTIEATEAATEFFLNAYTARTLTNALGRSPSAGNGFEVLLETTAIGGTARSSRIIAQRLLP